MKSKQSNELKFQIVAPGMDKNELEDFTMLLQREIAQLNVESVEPVSGGVVTKGAMPVEWYEIGSFIVKTAADFLPVLLTVKTALEIQKLRQGKGNIEKKDEIRVNVIQGSDVMQVAGNSTTEDIKRDLQNKLKAISEHKP